MLQLNENFLNLNQNYLFSEIAKRISDYTAANPDKPVIRLGIGDVTKPLTNKTIEALKEGVSHMASADTFKGYGPERGYEFLRKAVVSYYKRNGALIDAEEVFISDGAKSDTGNITDLFGPDNNVLIPDPVYPVYMDSNTMSGRNITFIDSNKDNGFTPMPYDGLKADIIYICSPNNPTGASYTRTQLKEWIDFALSNNSIILFDAAYECFIEEEIYPHSIFEIEGARKCAIEFCSLSKTAGFTGMRCGYTVIKKELVFDGVSAAALWQRRQGCKFNGVSYITQRAAEAVFTPEGIKQTREAVAYYKRNARVMTEAMRELGYWFTGGENSPYVWFKCPDNMGGWEYFDYLLNEKQIVGTPGEGFGKNGAGCMRLSAFGDAEKTREAMERIKKG